MADINQIVTLGIGTPSDIEHLILVGLNANPVAVVVIDTPYPVHAAMRDYSVTAADRNTAYVNTYSTSYLTDQNGNYLTDQSGNRLIVTVVTLQNVYSVTVPKRDYSVTVPEVS